MNTTVDYLFIFHRQSFEGSFQGSSDLSGRAFDNPNNDQRSARVRALKVARKQPHKYDDSNSDSAATESIIFASSCQGVKTRRGLQEL